MFKLKRNLRFKKTGKINNIVKRSSKNSISIFKSNKNFFSQFHSGFKYNILYSLSNLNFYIKDYIYLNFGKNLNVFVCKFLGKCISLYILKFNFKNLIFNRSGYKYHGHIKNFSNIIRLYGIDF